jgi:hypothetical protein
VPSARVPHLSNTPADDVWPPAEHGGPVGETDLGPRDAATGRPDSRARSRALLVIGGLVAVDAIMIAVNIAFGTSADFPERMNITRNHGWPEIFLYLQWLAAAAVLWKLRPHAALYAVWSMVFLYRFLDDFFELHRSLEHLLTAGPLWLLGPIGAAAEAKEILGHVASEIGLISLVVLALFVIRRGRKVPEVTRFSRHAIALMAVYLTFLLYGEQLVRPFISDRRIAVILEEGGEMIVGSLLLGLVLVQAAHLRSRQERLVPIAPPGRP